MSKILITGASGFVGTKLFDEFRKSGDEVYGTYYEHERPGLIKLNADNRKDIGRVIEEIRPEVVVHAAGIARAQACIENPSQAFRTNVLGTRDVARACSDFGARMVFLSTSHVFSGKSNRPYREGDVTKTSFDLYGDLKRLAENLALGELPSLITVRTELLLGFNENGPSHLFGQAVEGKLKLVINKTRQPLLLEDLADGIKTLIDKGEGGTFHIAGPDTLSYKEALEQLARIAGTTVDTNSEVKGLAHGIVLNTEKAGRLGIKPRDKEAVFSTLESQFRSIYPEGQRRSVEA